ncbi:MAG: hypothetical protein JWP58_972 [Hymenobacter sp.]|nr:hypothetical protein [Hymenobacter sp.]
MTRNFGQPQRLPAGALMLVIAVSMLVAAILLSLLFLTSNRRLLMQRDERRQIVSRNLLSGLAYAQASTSLPYLRRQSRDLFGEGADSVMIEKKPWGVFDVAVVIAARGQLSDTVMALLGSQFSEANQAALYLANENTPLSLNGDAQVRGGAYLPKGESARDANLPLTGPARTGPAVTGRRQPSRSGLPISADSSLARLGEYASLRLEHLLATGSQPTGNLRSLRTSFVGAAAVLYRPEPITLTELTLTGQIVVISSHHLVVEASNHLDNVLLIAPVVVVKSGFRGRVQIMARDTADIQANCELLYPSVVCAFSSRASTSPVAAPQVLLGENSIINGIVVAAQTMSGSHVPCTIRMGQGTTVQGQVFSAGTIENCGTVRGTVMCRRLVYRTPATFYDNYLVNAVVDRPALPAAFLTSPLLNAGAPTGIIAWLH